MKSYNKSASKFQRNDRMALVTGSTRGVGWGIVKGMAEAAHQSISNGKVKDVLNRRFQELCDLGYDTKPVFFDATDGVVVCKSN